MKLKLMLDSDGVFFDFMGGMKKMFDYDPPNGRVSDEEWKKRSEWVGYKIWSRPYFWIDLDLLPGAKEFYENFRPYNPTVLTAVPHNYPLDSIEAVTAAMEKKMAWRNHFGKEQADGPGRFIWTLSELKHTYCKAKEYPEHLYVLIDDHKSNINDWEKAGGIGILHESQDKTLSEFHSRVLSQLVPEVVV
jgi:hypothetical protein